MSIEYSYSRDNENFIGEYDTKEIAIEETKKDFGVEYIDGKLVSAGFRLWVGKNNPVEFGKFEIDADIILENIQESFYDAYGEVAEDLLDDVTQEHKNILEARLGKVFLEWAKEFNYKPSFYSVYDVEEVTV